MKTLILLLVLSTLTYAQKCDSKYDKFTNKTTHRCSVSWKTGFASINTAEVVARSASDVSLLLFTTNSEWKFLRVSKINLLIDSTKRITLDASHNGRINGYVVNESLSAPIDIDLLTELANARTIEVKAGGLAGTLDKKLSAKLKTLLQSLR